jgi:hypothetical protein
MEVATVGYHVGVDHSSNISIPFEVATAHPMEVQPSTIEDTPTKPASSLEDYNTVSSPKTGIKTSK